MKKKSIIAQSKQNHIHSLKKQWEKLEEIQELLTKKAMQLRKAGETKIKLEDVPEHQEKKFLMKLIDENEILFANQDKWNSKEFGLIIAIENISKEPYYELLRNAIILIEKTKGEIALEIPSDTSEENYKLLKIGKTTWKPEELSELEKSIEKISLASEKAKELEYQINRKHPKISTNDKVLVIGKILGKGKQSVYNLLDYEPSSRLK